MTDQVYRLIYPYFNPKSFRTHNRDQVEERRSQELLREKKFLARVDEMIKPNKGKVDVELTGKITKHEHPSETDSSRPPCDVSNTALIDGEEYQSVHCSVS